MAKVFAIVVTYNGMKWMDKCLSSLAKSEVPVTTVVIDNASTDGTPDYIEKHFPDVFLMRSDINYGFAKANNIGIRHALDNGADYVFLLNQDAWIMKNTIEALIETFDRHVEAGIVSPMHMNGAGNALDWKFATNLSGDFISDDFLHSLKDAYPVPYINAAAWLINKRCLLQVGGFDTNLFVHYGEDIDYTHRIKYWGYSLLVNPNAIIFHDREFRKGNDDEYKQQVFKRDQQIHNMKLEYGNINIDIDINASINKARYSKWKKYIKLQFSKIKRQDLIIETLYKIELSRQINKKGDGPWI